MVFTTGRLILSLTLLIALMFFVYFFSVRFSIVVITSLGEEGAGLYASRAFLCLS